MKQVALAAITLAAAVALARLAYKWRSRNKSNFLWKELSNFCKTLGTAAPPQIKPVDRIASQQYAQLLEQKRNLTPILQEFYSAKLSLRVLATDTDHHNNTLARCVTLTIPCAQSPSAVLPVEFAVIKIYLNNLPASIHADVRAGVRPFGAILLAAGIEQSVHPQQFFEMQSDALLDRLLMLPPKTTHDGTHAHTHAGAHGHTLRGRFNSLRAPDGRVIAEVMEVLRPVGVPRSDHEHVTEHVAA